MRNDRYIAISAIAHKSGVFEKLSEELQADTELVMEVVKHNVYQLNASEELRRDKEVPIDAVQNSSGALQWASNTLLDDKEVVLAAIKYDAFEISHPSNRLK